MFLPGHSSETAEENVRFLLLLPTAAKLSHVYLLCVWIFDPHALNTTLLLTEWFFSTSPRRTRRHREQSPRALEETLAWSS